MGNYYNPDNPGSDRFPGEKSYPDGGSKPSRLLKTNPSRITDDTVDDDEYMQGAARNAGRAPGLGKAWATQSNAGDKPGARRTFNVLFNRKGRAVKGRGAGARGGKR